MRFFVLKDGWNGISANGCVTKAERERGRAQGLSCHLPILYYYLSVTTINCPHRGCGIAPYIVVHTSPARALSERGAQWISQDGPLNSPTPARMWAFCPWHFNVSNHGLSKWALTQPLSFFFWVQYLSYFLSSFSSERKIVSECPEIKNQLWLTVQNERENMDIFFLWHKKRKFQPHLSWKKHMIFQCVETVLKTFWL